MSSVGVTVKFGATNIHIIILSCSILTLLYLCATSFIYCHLRCERFSYFHISTDNKTKSGCLTAMTRLRGGDHSHHAQLLFGEK